MDNYLKKMWESLNNSTYRILNSKHEDPSTSLFLSSMFFSLYSFVSLYSVFHENLEKNRWNEHIHCVQPCGEKSIHNGNRWTTPSARTGTDRSPTRGDV
jgi:hypothetical protein